MSKTILHIEFENGKAILTINPIESVEDTDETQAMITEFDNINMGSTEKVIRYDGVNYTIPKFIDYFRSRILTPEQRDIEDLKSRVAKIEQYLKRQPTQIKEPSRKHQGQEAIRNFHARIKGGEKKANKINKLLEISGLKIAPLSERGYTKYGPNEPGEIRSIVYVEQMFDDLGEDKFSEVINSVAVIDGICPKQIYFIAIRYAIDVGKMTGIDASLRAEPYFKADYQALLKRLKVASKDFEEKTGEKISNLGTVLGKVLVGEIKI